MVWLTDVHDLEPTEQQITHQLDEKTFAVMGINDSVGHNLSVKSVFPLSGVGESCQQQQSQAGSHDERM